MVYKKILWLLDGQTNNYFLSELRKPKKILKRILTLFEHVNPSTFALKANRDIEVHLRNFAS